MNRCTLSRPSANAHVLDRAMRIAQAERTVCCVIVPDDIQDMDWEKPPHEHGTIHLGAGYTAPRVTPPTQRICNARRTFLMPDPKLLFWLAPGH